MKLKLPKFKAARIEHKTFDNWTALGEYIAAHPLNLGSRMEITTKKQKNKMIYHLFVYREI